MRMNRVLYRPKPNEQRHLIRNIEHRIQIVTQSVTFFLKVLIYKMNPCLQMFCCVVLMDIYSLYLHLSTLSLSFVIQ